MTPEEKKWVEVIKSDIQYSETSRTILKYWIQNALSIIERQDGEIEKMRSLLLDNLAEEAQKMGLYDEEKPND